MRGLIKSDLAYPNLWQGCVGAWCPSVDRSRSTILTDHSRFGNHGTLTNMDPATDWVPSGGKVALDFDGVDDYVDLQTANWFIGGIGWTLSGWVKFTTTSRGSVLYQRNTGTALPFVIIDINSFGEPAGVIGMRSRDDAGNISSYTRSSVAINTGVWVYVSFVQRGASPSITRDLYINGVLDATLSSVTFGVATYDETTIGGANTLYANCQLDDIRIYNRALTHSEIKTLALRRGIAYETRRQSRGKAAGAATNRRRRTLCQ